ncbi:MAG: DUF3052 family protein [Chitinophagaceae bacterium]
MKLLLVQQPEPYYDWMGNDLSGQLCGKNDLADFIHVFIVSAKEMLPTLLAAKKRMHDKTIIWYSWYKKSAGMNTDVHEDVIRNTALQNGLVDVKVCAVTQQWSGLKLVVPLANRK